MCEDAKPFSQRVSVVLGVAHDSIHGATQSLSFLPPSPWEGGPSALLCSPPTHVLPRRYLDVDAWRQHLQVSRTTQSQRFPIPRVSKAMRIYSPDAPAPSHAYELRVCSRVRADETTVTSRLCAMRRPASACPFCQIEHAQRAFCAPSVVLGVGLCYMYILHLLRLASPSIACD